MEKKVYINGLKINYKIAGEGPVILILHGWGGSSDSWSQIQKILAGQGYKVICPDFPGFGKSQTPFKPWNLTDYVNWLIDFVDFLNLDKFFIISHSFGGRVAVKLAAKHPDKIEKLILCSPAGIKMNPNLTARITLYLSAAGDVVFSKKPLSILKGSMRGWLYFLLRRTDYVKANSVMRETMKKILEEDLLLHLSKIKIKTLIIWGKKDKIVPLKYGYIFKENIKNSQLEILPGMSHGLHLENPEKLLEIITKFL